MCRALLQKNVWAVSKLAADDFPSPKEIKVQKKLSPKEHRFFRGHVQSHLWLAIDRGQDRFLQVFCESAVTLDLLDEAGETPLHRAALAGNLQAVKIILRHPEKINIESQNDAGVTAIGFALHLGEVKIYHEIKSASPESNFAKAAQRFAQQVEEELAKTPLDEKILNRLLGLVLYYHDSASIAKLCSASPRLNTNIAHPETGDSPLHAASYAENFEAVKTLLNYPDVEANALNHRNETPLSIAYRFRNKDIIEYMLGHPGIDKNKQHSRKLDTILHVACRGGDDEMVKLLLSYPDLDPNVLNAGNEPPLYAACRSGNLEIVKLMLADERVTCKYTFIEEKNSLRRKETALSTAYRSKNLEILKLLLDHPQTNKNMRQLKGGDTVLHLACKEGENQIVELLLSYPDIEPNALNGQGEPPLFDACRSGNPDLLKLVLADERVDKTFCHPQRFYDASDIIGQMNRPDLEEILGPYFEEIDFQLEVEPPHRQG